MQAKSTTHPHADQLNAFALGKLESAEVDAVESHLASCDTCCDALKQMQEDTFVGLVRQSKEASPAPDAAAAGEVTLAAGHPSGEEQSSVSPAAVNADGRQDIPADLANHARYRVVGLLGKGGMGEVYKAEHRLMERMVALKVINPKFVGSKQAVERFRREVQAAARLDHANIVRAHDAEQAGNLHFLVMEHIEGTDLGQALERGPLPVTEACEYIRQAALGLEHAHERGMVHRDIKPQNLILSRLRESPGSQATIKILDFGIASLATEGATLETNADQPSTPDFQKPGLTQAGSLMGTPDYMAPEQGRDARAADTRSDIYSLGCTLYALLTGRVPFPGGTADEKIRAHNTRMVRPLKDVRGDVPAALCKVLDKMMAKDPADRYQRPAAVAAALAPYCRASCFSNIRDRLPRPRSYVPFAWAAVCAGLVALAGIVFYVVTDHGTIEIRVEDEKFTNDPIKIVASRNGKIIEVRDLKTKTNWVLDTGDWTLSLEGDPTGLAVVAPQTVTLKRGKSTLVTISRKPERPRDIGEIRRFEGHGDIVRSLAVSPDGGLMLSGGGENHGGDCDLRIWDVNKGTEIRRLEGHTAAVYGLAFSPDGRRALSGADRTVRLWDVATGKSLARFDGAPGFVFATAFSPDGRQALAGMHAVNNTGQLWLLDLETEKVIKRIDAPGQIFSVAFMPDGRRAFAGDYLGKLRLWDLESGEELKRFDGHSDWVLGISLSPDAQRVLTASVDRTMRLWDVATGNQLKVFPGHKGSISAVSYSPDGRRAATSSRDSTVRVWDLETGLVLNRLDAHATDSFKSVAFLPDGRHIVASYADGSIRLWHLPDVAAKHPVIDLLQIADAKADGVSGQWKLDRTGLSSPDQPNAKFAFPVRPLGDYRLVVKFSLTAPSRGGPVVCLPIGEHSAHFASMHPSGASALEAVDDATVDNPKNPTRTPGLPFEMKTVHTIVADVASRGEFATVRVAVNGKQVADWTGNPNRFSLKPAWNFGDNRRPGLRAWEAYQIHSVTLQMRSGALEMVRPTPDLDGWTELFNGKDLTGWKRRGATPATWKVDNGMLRGAGKAGYLVSEGQYGDFHLRAQVRINPGAAWGLLFNTEPEVAKGKKLGGYGADFTYKGQTNDVEGHMRLAIRFTKDGELMSSLTANVKPNDWVPIEVIVQNGAVDIKVPGGGLGGLKMPPPNRGPIVLHLPNDNAAIEFLKIEIKDLAAGR